VRHTISFDLSVDPPFTPAVEIISKLGGDGREATDRREVTHQALAQELLQASVAFVNDSLQRCLYIQFALQDIAAGCVYIAGRKTGIRPRRKEWTDSCVSSGGVPPRCGQSV